MKYKVGDRVKVKNEFDFCEEYRGEQFIIEECDSSDDTYFCHLITGGYGIWFSEEKLEPLDSKTLRMADGTIIGEFGTGDTLPTSEWSKLIFKNGSSIEVLPQKGDAVRGENHFCNGFKGGKIPTPSKPISIEEQLGLPKGVSIHDLDMTSLYRPMNIEIQPLELVCDEEQAKNIAERLAKELNGMLGVSFTKKEEKKMSTKFTFYVTEGTRPDKNPDGDGKGVIPTMTTFVSIGRYYSGKATCDKADYNERQGCLEAIANAVLGGNFDREYEKFLADKKRKYNESCKCKICGRNYYEDEKTGKRTPFTPEDARKHEEWHEQNKKNKRERYLLRKRAKEIAFEEQAQKMAKEIIAENKKEAK